MTAADIKALGYRVYEAMNARNIKVLAELFAPHFISHASGITGIEGAKNALDQHYTTFPDSPGSTTRWNW